MKEIEFSFHARVAARYLLLDWRTVSDMTRVFVCVTGTVFHKYVWALRFLMWWCGGASRPCREARGTGVGLSLLPSGSFFNYSSLHTIYTSPLQMRLVMCICVFASFTSLLALPILTLLSVPVALKFPSIHFPSHKHINLYQFCFLHLSEI